MLKPCYCDLAMLPPPDVVTCFIHAQFCLFKNSFSLCRWDLETMTKNNTISRALNNGWCDCFWTKCMFVCLLKTGKRKKENKWIKKKGIEKTLHRNGLGQVKGSRRWYWLASVGEAESQHLGACECRTVYPCVSSLTALALWIHPPAAIFVVRNIYRSDEVHLKNYSKNNC